MTIDDLKTRLERINAWPMVMTHAQAACEIEDLGDDLYKMAAEIIALWQSVNILCYPPEDCPATCLTQLAVVRENLDWLNSKLADL